MNWQFWKRNTNDPIVKAFFEKYDLNLLSIPREGVAIGDLYSGKDSHEQNLARAGHIDSLLEPSFTMPQPITGETMADLDDTMSNAISANVALDFLESFLNVLGGGKFGTNVRAHFHKNRTSSAQFNFAGIKRDHVDPYLVGDKLGDPIKKYKVKGHNIAYDPGRQHYIVTGVVRTPSISILAKGEDNKSLEIEANATELAKGAANVSVKKNYDGKVTFSGPKELAIGVELHTLQYDPSYNAFKMEPVTEYYKVHGEETERSRQVLRRAIVGDPREGSIFVDIA